MIITARPATRDDVDSLVTLYRALEEEQTALRPMWRLADGLPEPPGDSLEAILADEESLLVVGLLDEVPLGFAWAAPDDLLPQANGDRVAVVRLIHTELEARGVGIGEAMIDLVLGHFRALGFTKFDARVSPGHRNAKNFFESQEFKARLIVMHHDDDA
jgi:GNAT superfamily N-acetyltransferase